MLIVSHSCFLNRPRKGASDGKKTCEVGVSGDLRFVVEPNHCQDLYCAGPYQCSRVPVLNFTLPLLEYTRQLYSV